MTEHEAQQLNEEWWDDATPSLIDRVSALVKTIKPGSDHEVSSAIAARPWSAARDSDETVHLDIYKVWFVLHRDVVDEDDRTTNLYLKHIGKATTRLDRVTPVGIQASLLPLKNEYWVDKMKDFNE